MLANGEGPTLHVHCCNLGSEALSDVNQVLDLEITLLDLILQFVLRVFLKSLGIGQILHQQFLMSTSGFEVLLQ